VAQGEQIGCSLKCL